MPKTNILDSFIELARKRGGNRPNGFYEHMKPGSPKYVETDPLHFSSADPANVASFKRDGMSYKMVPSERVYANRWYADPENMKRAGYAEPIDPNAFRAEFEHRGGPTLYEREMAQRQYDKRVGQDVGRMVAEEQATQSGIEAIYEQLNSFSDEELLRIVAQNAGTPQGDIANDIIVNRNRGMFR